MFRLSIKCLLYLCWYGIYCVCFFYINSFNTLSNSDLVIVGPNSPKVISTYLSNFQAFLNHSTTIQRFVAICLLFHYLVCLVIILFILGFPKLSNKFVWFFSISSITLVFSFFTVLFRPVLFIFLSFSVSNIYNSVTLTFVLIILMFPSLFYES